jgi:superfamily II DNA/RNA helicase
VKVRGLDLPDLEHLTLFDFPRDAVEYLRRVGMATRGAGIERASGSER